MREVGFVSQGVYDEGVDALYLLEGLGRHGLAVCDISETAYPEAYDGQLEVENGQRRDLDAVDRKGLVATELVEVELRHTGVRMLAETVRHTVAEVFGHIGTAVNREIAVFAIWTQVVDAADVVVVAVGQQRGIEMRRAERQYLLPVIGTAVDEEAAASDIDDGRSTKSFILRVGRATDVAVAPYLRDAGRGTGT